MGEGGFLGVAIAAGFAPCQLAPSGRNKARGGEGEGGVEGSEVGIEVESSGFIGL